MSERVATQRDLEGILRRLNGIESKIDRERFEVPYGFGQGTAFPSSPANNDVFFRTDLDLLCFYDGTRWLTLQEYEANISSFGLNPLPFAGAGPSTIALAAARSDRQLYTTYASLYLFVNTTNNATNYWTIRLQDSVGNVFWQPNTSADAAGEIVKVTALAAGAASPSISYWTLRAQKTNAPGNITAIHGTVFYRQIVT